MDGKVRVYSDAVRSGLITGIDGKDYPFSKSEWLVLGEPGDNTKVVFEKNNNRAWQVKAA